jgi:hypothetical protein
MRILVTKQGNIIIQEIDDTIPFMPKINNTFNSSKFRGYSTGYKKQNPQYKFQSKFNKFSKTNNLFYNYSSFSNINQNNFSNSKIKLSKNMNLDDMEITKEEINTAKQIKINEKKISFPKQFIEKYENDNFTNINSSNNIFPSITSKNKESYDDINNSLVKREKFLSLGEIIPDNLKIQMKKKILNDRKIRDKATIITQNDFRTEYDPETDIQKFNNILSESKVNSNKSSLIKYLNEKKVNPLTVKIISNRNGNKINKINKMCQIIFQNEEKEKLFNDLVRKKLAHRMNTQKKEFQNNINILGNDIGKIKEKLEKYEKRVDNKERYREHFNDMIIHYWLKRDLERFNKKSTPKPEYLKTFLE